MSERILMLGWASHIAQERAMRWVLEWGYEVILLTPENSTPKLLADERLLMITYPRKWLPISITGDPHPQMSSLARLIEIVVDLFDVALVHLHGLSNAAIALKDAEISASRLVSAWGSLNTLLYDPDQFVSHNSSVEFCISALPAMDGVIVESPTQVDLLNRQFPSINTVSLIPMGVDTRLFELSGSVQKDAFISRLRLNIGTDDIVFCSPRGWAPNYQHELILRAFARGQQGFEKRSWLLILGLRSTGVFEDLKEDWKRITALSEALGVKAQVIWIPQLPYEQMPALYAMSDIVVNMPLGDSFPSTLMEAMACERVVISSDLITYRQTTLYSHLQLVKGNDEHNLSQKMVEVARWPAEVRRELGKASRQTVVTEFSKEICQARMLETYARLIDSSESMFRQDDRRS